MVYLLLSILMSSALFVILKLFEKYNVNTFQAIIANYFIALIIGYTSSDIKIDIVDIPNQPWFPWAILLSFSFITVFNLMAATTQKNGLSVSSVTSKMSVIIPVISGVFLYNESLKSLKILGIILALFSVYLVTGKETKKSVGKSYLIFPILLFIGSGLLDAVVKYIEKNYLYDGVEHLFSATVFTFAFSIGIIILAIRRKLKFQLKNIIAGAVLVVPNYLSIIFLLKALKTEGLESSTLYTINNVSIVLFTSLLGLVLFKEKLQPRNKIGILVAVVSIVLVAIA